MPAGVATTKHLLEETVWGSGGWNVPARESGGWGTGISGVLMWEWMVFDDVSDGLTCWNWRGWHGESPRKNRRYYDIGGSRYE